MRESAAVQVSANPLPDLRPPGMTLSDVMGGPVPAIPIP
jgi:hypothetical protein